MLLSAFVFGLFLHTALGVKYEQTDNIQGSGFFGAFSYEAIADPTHGRVNYIDAERARAQNLTFASGDHFILRGDYMTRLRPDGPGRDSVRLISNKQFGADTVLIFNIRHMPVGCGTWPAIWTVGASNWPHGGEIDILEGVNDVAPNHVTLHTSHGCTMPSPRPQTGTPLQNDCDVAVNYNAGCGVGLTERATYGREFNSEGGGWYALERTDSFIKVWFWGRNSANVPADILNGETRINTNRWGTPSAYFPNTSCDIRSKFDLHNVVINLTFCGDWAGNVYHLSGCPSTCVEYVNYNPSQFDNAYFDIKWMKAYAVTQNATSLPLGAALKQTLLGLGSRSVGAN